MTVILVRYAEIALKGANRPLFEEQLQNNIRQALNFPLSKVRRFHTQFVVYPEAHEEGQALQNLGKAFGIAWYAPAQPCETSLPTILKTGLQVALETINPNDTFAVRAQRSDKSLPFTSPEIERRLGEVILQSIDAQVDLENPDKTIYVSASTEGSYIYTQKIAGPGGLPVGSSGKVLSLLSGGPDSIVSSYYLAKRGAQVDFLHFHVFPNKDTVLDSKISAIVTKLSEYTFSKRIFLSSYLPFEMHMLGFELREPGYELVVFRRLMAQVAEALAREHGYQAIVFGDSLGQVASQTMENIAAVSEGISLPIFRPLIGMDKLEIIRVVEEIGLFDQATAEYKDCCSIIAPNPVTKAYLPFVHTIEKELNFSEIVQEMVEQIEEVLVPSKED